MDNKLLLKEKNHCYSDYQSRNVILPVSRSVINIPYHMILNIAIAAENCSYSAAIRTINGEEDGFLKEAKEKSVKLTLPACFPETIAIEESVAASRYLAERNIPEEVVRHFGLAFCQKNLVIDEKTTLWTKNRIIVPIKNMAGETVSWQGRDCTGRSKVRYLFPPEFRGAEELYNIDAISVNPSYLIVSEGICGDLL